MRISILLAGSACVALFATTPVAWSETLTTVPTPSFTLSDSAVTLTDTATLSGASTNATGLIRFELTAPTPGVSFTTTDAVAGNGDYLALIPLGTGTVTGTYIWNVLYTGDGNNGPVLAPTEATTVSPAIPGLKTTASAFSETGGFTQLLDVAQLSGGFFPTGVIHLTLTGPGGVFFTMSDAVAGDGNYLAVTDVPTIDGTYLWNVSYTGDGNNVAEFETEDVTVGETVGATPIPAALPLFATGLGGLGLLGWRRKRKAHVSLLGVTSEAGIGPCAATAWAPLPLRHAQKIPPAPEDLQGGGLHTLAGPHTPS